MTIWETLLIFQDQTLAVLENGSEQDSLSLPVLHVIVRIENAAGNGRSAKNAKICEKAKGEDVRSVVTMSMNLHCRLRMSPLPVGVGVTCSENATNKSRNVANISRKRKKGPVITIRLGTGAIRWVDHKTFVALEIRIEGYIVVGIGGVIKYLRCMGVGEGVVPRVPHFIYYSFSLCLVVDSCRCMNRIITRLPTLIACALSWYQVPNDNDRLGVFMVRGREMMK